jgi:hypothetical protein
MQSRRPELDRRGLRIKRNGNTLTTSDTRIKAKMQAV